MGYIILLLALFGVKHFVCDFVLQTNTMLKDKGTYGAPGGVKHATIHAVGTLILLLLVFHNSPEAELAALLLGIFDGVVHYHIDYAKTNLSQGLTPADNKFWLWLGADQGLHYLTYVTLIAIIVLF